MNQTPAAIVVLAASVLGYASLSAADNSGTAVLVGLAAAALGIWGLITLLGASIAERESTEGQVATRSDLVDRFLKSSAVLAGIRPTLPANSGPTPTSHSPAPASAPSAARTAPTLEQLPSDIKAQLSVVAHLQGKDHCQLIEEALRHYLPQSDRNRAA